MFYIFFLENFIDGIIPPKTPLKPLYKGGYGREGGGGPHHVGGIQGICGEEYTILWYTPPSSITSPLHYLPKLILRYRLQIGRKL
jgi:hypothetical protein